MVDVDGVLSPITDSPSPGLIPHEVGFKTVYLNPQHASMLGVLARQTDGELVWCTMWGPSANYDIGPLIGLPDLPVVPIQEDHDGIPLGAHKAAAAVKYAAGRPFIWFDDEPDAHYWLAHLREGPANVIAVDPARGLTRHHIRLAKNWMKSKQARMSGLTAVRPVVLAYDWTASPALSPL